MDEKISNWDDLALFLAVARGGGLAPAARETGRSPATLGRRMLALERSLGRELFIRHDRGYSLTADGRAYLDDLTGVESRILQLTQPTAMSDRPLVKISAGTWTTVVLLEHMPRLMGSPPDTRLRFVSVEEILDIPHREVAIGFRIGRPQDDSLAGRKLARNEFAIYATKDAPDQWIKVLSDTPSARWVDRNAGRDVLCEVTAPRNCLDLALKGFGHAVLPTFIGDRYPALMRRGEAIAELSHDQWLVTHQDDRHLPEVRRVLDRLVDVMGPRR